MLMMKPHKVRVYLRHFVHDKPSLEWYRRILVRADRASRLCDFDFIVMAKADTRLPQVLRAEFDSINSRILDSRAGFSLHVADFSDILLFKAFNDTLEVARMGARQTIGCVLDADSYAIDNVDFLRRVRRLADSMVQNDAIMGLAQKTKVLLGSGDMEVYREIDEAMFALCLGSSVSVKRSMELKVPPAYAEFGDPVPGFYCINSAHRGAHDLVGNMERDIAASNMSHFTGDFYVVLAASQIGKIETEIMPLEGNPPGVFKFEDIGRKANELGRTSLRKVYLRGIKSDENRERIEKYYSPEAVEKVRDTILKAMLWR